MIRILLVDDHPILRHGVSALLSTQEDFQVVAEAGSLEETARALARHEVDLALVDLDLGTGNPGGIEVTKMIRREFSQTRVIIFSAYDADADVVRALDAGASDYLVKDTQPTQLFRVLRLTAGGDGSPSGNLTHLLRRQNDPEALTAREIEVLGGVAAGLSNRELARELFISEATIKTHLHHCFTKLGVDNRQAAVALALKRGLIRI